MRFWDASAVVVLILDQPHTATARSLIEEDPDVVMWWGTPLECASALARCRREGVVGPSDEATALRALDELRASWYEVLPGESVRAQAMRVLRIHQLRSADALQLGAALEWSGIPAGGMFVTFDRRLAVSAELEGFRIAGVP